MSPKAKQAAAQQTFVLFGPLTNGLSAYADGPLPSIAKIRHAVQQNCNKFQQKVSKRYWYLPILKTTCYNSSGS